MGSTRAALLFGVLAAPVAPLLPGCAVEAEPRVVGGYATVYPNYPTEVPPDIYAYPRVYYDGSHAYLVGDRWYYPYADRWLVLRAEPLPLYRYRTDYMRGPFFGGYANYDHRTYVQPGVQPRVNVAPPARNYYGRPPPALRVP